MSRTIDFFIERVCDVDSIQAALTPIADRFGISASAYAPHLDDLEGIQNFLGWIPQVWVSIDTGGNDVGVVVAAETLFRALPTGGCCLYDEDQIIVERRGGELICNSKARFWNPNARSALTLPYRVMVLPDDDSPDRE